MDGKPCAGAWITASVSKWLSLAVSFSVFSSFEKQVPISWHRGVCLPREKMRVNASQPGGETKHARAVSSPIHKIRMLAKKFGVGTEKKELSRRTKSCTSN